MNKSWNGNEIGFDEKDCILDYYGMSGHGVWEADTSVHNYG